MNQDPLADNVVKAVNLMKKREKDKAEMERKKAEIEQEISRRGAGVHIKDKFGGSKADLLEQQFHESTVGLVSREEFLAKAEQLRSGKEIKTKETEKKPTNLVKRNRKEFESNISTLSFAEEEEEEQATVLPPRKGIGKNPTVDTSFLPDEEREEKERVLRQLLRERYLHEQEVIRNQVIETSYAYWENLNAVKTLKVKKSTRVGVYLELCRRELAKEFHDLRPLSGEGLMLVSNDAVIPNNISFYDIIAQDLQGKYGPVLRLKTREDKAQDGTSMAVEFVEGKPFRIIDRRWYEKHKHIYPCTVWDFLDASRVVE